MEKTISIEDAKKLRSSSFISSVADCKDIYTLEMKDGTKVQIGGTHSSAYAGDSNSHQDTGNDYKNNPINFDDAIKVHRYFKEDIGGDDVHSFREMMVITRQNLLQND